MIIDVIAIAIVLLIATPQPYSVSSVISNSQIYLVLDLLSFVVELCQFYLDSPLGRFAKIYLI